jgi:uncharacterized membrane protein YjjB (DUF3815 family)
MIPGAFAAKAILGLLAITTQHSITTNGTLVAAMDDTLRVTFTMGALGTGVAIRTILLRVRKLNGRSRLKNNRFHARCLEVRHQEIVRTS